MARDGGPPRGDPDLVARRHDPHPRRIDPGVARRRRTDARRWSGTVEQVVEQLVAYRDAGVSHVHTFVSTDATIGLHDPVDGMELFLREVWPAFLAA